MDIFDQFLIPANFEELGFPLFACPNDNFKNDIKIFGKVKFIIKNS